ncbi:hypothetical protein [Microtetraspora fusca]|uniref:hypothetical protein n=1 Tax=Microtetraspora fusca TaxID=1997 RepID=UPI0008372F36|nr:hypothetical protein [Microtetraspora fusca]
MGALVTIAVALPDVVTLSLLAVDRVLDEACAATWEQWLHGWSILWYFHGPLIAAVVVVAVSIRPALSRSSVHG